MPGTFSLPPTSKETARLRSRHARAVMHVGIANPRCAGKTFPAHAQPTILHICQEAHYSDAKWASWRLKLPAVGGIYAVIIVFQITGHSTFFNKFLMLIWQKIPKLRIIGHLWDYYSIMISGHISAGHIVTITGKSAVMTLAVTSHQCQWHVSWRHNGMHFAFPLYKLWHFIDIVSTFELLVNTTGHIFTVLISFLVSLNIQLCRKFLQISDIFVSRYHFFRNSDKYKSGFYLPVIHHTQKITSNFTYLYHQFH